MDKKIRKVIEKSCLYVNSKCPDKDVDVTMLIKEIQEEFRGALARAYCTERNKHKVLDTDLIEDMITELTNTPKRR